MKKIVRVRWVDSLQEPFWFWGADFYQRLQRNVMNGFDDIDEMVEALNDCDSFEAEIVG